MNTTQTTPKLTTSAMIASFADPGQKTASAPFGHALARLAQERPEIVGLSADLAKYTDMHVFRDAHPDRFFQMGMAEQAMLGAAAGLAEVVSFFAVVVVGVVVTGSALPRAGRGRSAIRARPRA